MKYRKTPRNQRGTYKLYDEHGQLVIEFKPGENGVTERDIRNLHALDDHEVYVNCKELRLTPHEQKMYQIWRKKFIADFIIRNGRAPQRSEIPPARRQFVYLDDLNEDEDGNFYDEVSFPELTVQFQDEPGVPVERLREVVSGMKVKWQQVYGMTELYGYSTSEVARAMGITDRRIRAMKARIRQGIAEDELLRKIFP
jgi:hypothetical protein